VSQTLQATRGSVPDVQGSERELRGARNRTRSRRRNLSPFVLVLTGWTILAHVPIAMGAYSVLHALGSAWPGWFAVAIAVALAAPFRRRMLALMPDRPRPAWLLQLIDIPYFAHWCASSFALAWTSAACVVWASARLVVGHAPFSLTAAAACGYAVGGGLAAWGVWVRRKWVRVRRLTVPVQGLDPAFDGYTIVQLSDLHIGSFSPQSMAMGWVRMANGLDADLVAVTGDLITNGDAFHETVGNVIGALRARDGVVVSPGNHDYFGEPEALFDRVRAAGARVLANDSFVVRRGKAALVIAGADDTWTRRADVRAALSKRLPGAPVVLLAHDPELFPAAARQGVQLVLSGHTHGGQVAMPWLARHVNLSKLSHRFHLGEYRDGASWLHVSGGLGTTGPPVRVGSAPEMTLICLRAARA